MFYLMAIPNYNALSAGLIITTCVLAFTAIALILVSFKKAEAKQEKQSK